MDRQIAPEEFNKQCALVLAKYVDKHDELVWARNDSDKVSFTCKNKTNPIYRDGTYLLRIKDNSSLLVHCHLTYVAPGHKASVKSDFIFQGISLQFYHGIDSCFCRAEWDVKDKPEKLEHPQPHWHWGAKNDGGYLDNDFADGQAAFEIYDNPFVGVRKPDINFSELHYAMCTNWLGKGENNLTFTFQNLTKWLENAMIMVVDQYNYQVSKKGFVSVRK